MDEPSVTPPDGTELKRTLGPLMLWGLGVGYVISGMYFGWNLGLKEGGPFGMLAATLLVTVMYVTFVLGYAELSCAMPRAGGAFIYAHHGLGPRLGFLAALAQWIEFVFAPPAIAAAIGAYLGLYFTTVSPIAIGIGAYMIFTAINIWGVRVSAMFELLVTIVAVAELLLFAGVAGTSFRWEAFASDPLPNGWAGMLGAIPFAIWFYLAIEGIANVAEEAKAPQRDLPRGFLTAMGTLVFLALAVLFTGVGVAGWKAAVFGSPGSEATSDSPLPLVLKHVVGDAHPLYKLLIGVGLSGLVASFHGIILVAGRATMELGRVGYAPRIVGTTHPTRKTPAAALIVNMLVGIAALLSGKTAEIITISVLGAVTLYVLSTLALFRLRRTHPDLERPFRTPGYPVVPAVALVLSIAALIALAVATPWLALVYGLLLVTGFVYYFLLIPKSVRDAALPPLCPRSD